jgi:hypothetical protein
MKEPNGVLHSGLGRRKKIRLIFLYIHVRTDNTLNYEKGHGKSPFSSNFRPNQKFRNPVLALKINICKGRSKNHLTLLSISSCCIHLFWIKL